MFPRPTSLARLRAPFVAALLAAVAAVAVGCAASFDPTGPCTADGRSPGAYPSLEAMVPRDLDGRPATRVDSGRTCTPAGLASLATHGITQLRFAGSTWETGPNAGVTSAIFEAPDIRADWVHEFYRLGAESARNTETVETSRVQLKPGEAFRIDTLNGESWQTVVNWQDGDRVRVVLVASFIREVDTRAAHDRVVQQAIAGALAAQGSR